MLNKGTTGTIFITALVWRGPWLGIEPGTSRTRSQHSTTRLLRRRYRHHNFVYIMCSSLTVEEAIHFIQTPSNGFPEPTVTEQWGYVLFNKTTGFALASLPSPTHCTTAPSRPIHGKLQYTEMIASFWFSKYYTKRPSLIQPLHNKPILTDFFIIIQLQESDFWTWLDL